MLFLAMTSSRVLVFRWGHLFSFHHGRRFVYINFWLKKKKKVHCRKKMGYHVWLSSTTVKIATNSNFPLLTCLLKLFKATCCATLVVAVIPTWVLVKTGVQKFMTTKPRPYKPWRGRLESLKSSFSYVKLRLKISSKVRKCPSKAKEDIYQICCSICT